MKRGGYVIVDDGANFVTFHELNVRIKIKKINSSQREFGPPVYRLIKLFTDKSIRDLTAVLFQTSIKI